MKKGLKKIGIVLFFLVLLSSVFVSAITGKIGNAKMILTVEVGDVVDRTIRVINDNDVTLNITLSGSGDLEDDINMIDDNFILEAGEEKNARFTIEVREAGVFDNRINVQFAPVNGGNGVGLAAQIIIKAGGDEEPTPEPEDEEEDEIIDDGNDDSNRNNNKKNDKEEGNEEINDSENLNEEIEGGNSILTGGVIGTKIKDNKSLVILLSTSGMLLLAFFVLLYSQNKLKNNVRGNKTK